MAGPIETMPLTDWRLQFDVLFFGPIALTQQLLPQLRASRGRGDQRDLNRRDGMPGPMIAAYQSAKARIGGGERLDADWKFSPFGVYVSAIAPASISTPMLKRSLRAAGTGIADALPKSLQPFYADALRAFAKTTVRGRRKIFNLSGEGISDDPPGGDGTASPSPLPDRGGRERRRVPQAQTFPTVGWMRSPSG